MSTEAIKTALISPDGLLTYFTHIFANSKDVINLFSLTQKKIVLWNEAATASMGYTLADFETIPLEKRYPPEEFIKLTKSFETLAKDGYAFEKVKMYAKNGELKDLWIRSFVIQTDPEVICLVHTIDVTEERKKEDRAVREAKLATLGEAVAALSHELSNPLQLIEFNLSLIETSEDKLSEDSTLRVEKIKTAISRMSDIITSVMKYVRQTRVQTTTFTSLAAVTKDALDILRGYLDQKNIEVEIDIPIDLPLVKADAGQVQQILLILTKNAAQALIDHSVRKIKFSSNTTENKIELLITDSGPGIPEEVQKNIFDAFSTTKPVGLGCGLGLSIAKRLAISNSIEINFKSEVDVGTVFSLDFERDGYLYSSGIKSSLDWPYHGKIALVVDDNANNLADMSFSLESLKIKVLIASSAREGLNLLTVQKFDFIFCSEIMYPISGAMFVKEARVQTEDPICLIGSKEEFHSDHSIAGLDDLFSLKRPFYMADINAVLKLMSPDTGSVKA